MCMDIIRLSSFYKRLAVLLFLLMIVEGESSVARADESTLLFSLGAKIDRASPQAENSAYLKTLMADPANQEFYWVDTNPSIISAASRQLTLSVPGDKVLTFNQTNFEPSLGGVGTWVGDAPSVPKAIVTSSQGPGFNPLTYALITREGNRLVGTLRVGGQPYTLTPLEGGRHVLIKLDESKLPPQGEPEDGLGGGADETVTPADTPVTRLRVLMVTTNQSRAQYPSMPLNIANAIAAANLYTVNSEVQIKFELAGIYNPDYDEIGNSGDLLNHLRSVTHQDLGKYVAVERERLRAHLVSMVIKANDTCGRGYLSASKALAYSVVNCFSSLAHEMGHNLGANHNWEPGDAAGNPPYMFGFRTGGNAVYRFSTQMSAACRDVSCPRVPYFSNPKIYYEGQSMGSEEHHNVARRFNERRGTVANFYPD